MAAGHGNDVLLHVGKLLHDGGPEGVENVLGILVGLGLHHATEEVVKGVAVREARGPRVWAPVVRFSYSQALVSLDLWVGAEACWKT